MGKDDNAARVGGDTQHPSELSVADRDHHFAFLRYQGLVHFVVLRFASGRDGVGIGLFKKRSKIE
jgi:hypothetical protein